MKDLVEGSFVLFREEDVVRLELGNGGVKGPVEGDGGAGAGARGEGLRIRGGREEVVVGVDEVGVADDGVGVEGFAGGKGDARGLVRGGGVDGGHGGGEVVLDAEAAGDGCYCGGYLG